ncbi:hypothetical protein [Nocardia asteroides]|uniref:hypothetical protein n=1 Tax=Nocardia asteroides TaxID=1824 RepID=UPI001E33C62C|nr:hypothetical protein [Nocardia asteroides]UGT55939.1 hypothetical protein LTT85_03370 [Nocardia asteroides]
MSTPLRCVAAWILGSTLMLGGLIYAFTSQSELEKSSVTTMTCLNRENMAIGGLDCTTGARDEVSTQALASRVAIGIGVMVSGAVVLGAGIVSGRQQLRHTPLASVSPAAQGQPPLQ